MKLHSGSPPPRLSGPSCPRPHGGGHGDRIGGLKMRQSTSLTGLTHSNPARDGPQRASEVSRAGLPPTACLTTSRFGGGLSEPRPAPPLNAVRTMGAGPLNPQIRRSASSSSLLRPQTARDERCISLNMSMPPSRAPAHWGSTGATAGGLQPGLPTSHLSQGARNSAQEGFTRKAVPAASGLAEHEQSQLQSLNEGAMAQYIQEIQQAADSERRPRSSLPANGVGTDPVEAQAALQRLRLRRLHGSTKPLDIHVVDHMPPEPLAEPHRLGQVRHKEGSGRVLQNRLEATGQPNDDAPFGPPVPPLAQPLPSPESSSTAELDSAVALQRLRALRAAKKA